MTKHTEKVGKLPNASIDFSKVHANARAGKDDVFDKALSHQRKAAEPDAGEAAVDKVALAAPVVPAADDDK
jgi:hypothetical protein